MKFQRVEDAIAVCKKHLDSTSSRGTEVESCLVAYLLVLICAEYETRLEELVNRRAARTKDVEVCGFVKHAADKIIRSIKISEISGFLGHFGCQQKFKDKKDDQAYTAYDNIITNRHLVAHNTGTLFTFSELEAAFGKSHVVFDAVCHALAMTPAEIAGLI